MVDSVMETVAFSVFAKKIRTKKLVEKYARNRQKKKTASAPKLKQQCGIGTKEIASHIGKETRKNGEKYKKSPRKPENVSDFLQKQVSALNLLLILNKSAESYIQNLHT